CIDIPVVQRLDLGVELTLPAGEIAVEVVLLLPAGNERQLPVPGRRFGELPEYVPAHVDVIGAGEERDVVVLETRRPKVGRYFPKPAPRIAGEPGIRAEAAQHRGVRIVGVAQETVRSALPVRSLEVPGAGALQSVDRRRIPGNLRPGDLRHEVIVALVEVHVG